MIDVLTPDGMVTAFAKAKTLPELWQAAFVFVRARGIEMVSYDGDDARGYDTKRAGIIEFGVSPEWIERYQNANLGRVDPITELAARLSRPFYWSETAELAQLSPAQREYMRLLAGADIGDGLAMQVYGPNMRNACVSLGLGKTGRRLTDCEVFELHCTAQIAHLRFCALTEDGTETAPLSPRETEVLKWMAKGKSNAVIADILGLSRHTVDTICRRVFDKLDVHDRTSAAIRGIGAGLLGFRRKDRP